MKPGDVIMVPVTVTEVLADTFVGRLRQGPGAEETTLVHIWKPEVEQGHYDGPIAEGMTFAERALGVAGGLIEVTSVAALGTPDGATVWFRERTDFGDGTYTTEEAFRRRYVPCAPASPGQVRYDGPIERGLMFVRRNGEHGREELVKVSRCNADLVVFQAKDRQPEREHPEAFRQWCYLA